MLKILFKGIQPSLDLDLANAPGGLLEDEIGGATRTYLEALKGGRLCAIGSNGKAKLCDGAADQPIGFIINDCLGGFYENKPAYASGKLASTYGETVVITDQIDTALTFAPGEKLYAGTGAKTGLVTNVSPGAGAVVIGVAASAASAAAPELKIFAH